MWLEFGVYGKGKKWQFFQRFAHMCVTRDQVAEALDISWGISRRSITENDSFQHISRWHIIQAWVTSQNMTGRVSTCQIQSGFTITLGICLLFTSFYDYNDAPSFGVHVSPFQSGIKFTLELYVHHLIFSRWMCEDQVRWMTLNVNTCVDRNSSDRIGENDQSGGLLSVIKDRPAPIKDQ